MANTSIDQLAAEIGLSIQEYTENVSEAVAKKTDQVAKAVLKETKALANSQLKGEGKYVKGFTIVKEDEYCGTKRIIWNKKYYSRVHLLEKGHAKRGGGRVKAFPHVQPAYEKYGAPLPDHIKRIIRNGGGD